MSVLSYSKIRQNREETERDLAKILLRAILDQTDPKVQEVLVDKLGTGPLGAQVAGCIDGLTRLGLTVRALPETRPATTPETRQ